MFDWQPYGGGRGAAFAWPVLMLLASHVVSASAPARPSRRSHTPWQKKITAFCNSRAGLPPGFCGSDCFLCAFFYSVYLDLSPCFYLEFFTHSLFVFTLRGFIMLSVYISFVLPFLSCCLSIILSCSPCTEFIFTFLHPCHYFRTVKRLQSCTHWLLKHVKAKDRDKKLLQLLWSFTSKTVKAPYHTLLFSISSSIREDWLGSFDMPALIRLNAVPYLTQAPCKSAQIGEPRLDRGHNMAVNHR